MDEYEWFGPCERCGTSHDGWPPELMGGSMRCLAAQAARLAAEIPAGIALADQIDALQRHNDQRRDDALRGAGLIR